MPTRATWARNNWGDLIRLPAVFSNNRGMTYVEYRSPDPACNPYLAFAALLEAGLAGVRAELAPPPMRPSHMPHEEAGPELPRTLVSAIEHAQSSEVLSAALGPRLLETLLSVARLEWQAYHSHVSTWEQDRYFPEL